MKTTMMTVAQTVEMVADLVKTEAALVAVGGQDDRLVARIGALRLHIRRYGTR